MCITSNYATVLKVKYIYVLCISITSMSGSNDFCSSVEIIAAIVLMLCSYESQPTKHYYVRYIISVIEL